MHVRVTKFYIHITEMFGNMYVAGDKFNEKSAIYRNGVT